MFLHHQCTVQCQSLRWDPARTVVQSGYPPLGFAAVIGLWHVGYFQAEQI